MSSENYKTKNNYQKLKPKSRVRKALIPLLTSPSFKQHNSKYINPFSSFQNTISSPTDNTNFYTITQPSDSLLTTNKKSKSKHLKSVEEHIKEVDSIMEKYVYRNPHPKHLRGISNILTRTKQEFYYVKQKEISRILNQTKVNHLETDETKIQIKSTDTNAFKGPFETLGVITKNKVIHDKLLENYQQREVQTFEKSMDKVSFLETQKKICDKVKITPTMPKVIEQNIFDNNNTNIKNNSRNNIQDNTNKITSLTEGNGDYANSSHNNKKKIINIPNINFIKNKLYLLAKTIYSPKGFPENREQFSFSLNATETEIILYGGFSSNIHSNSLWKLTTANFTWTNLPSTSMQPDIRIGHTGIIFKNKFIIFGGRYIQVPILADLDVYNIDTNTWSNPAVNTTRYLKLRKHHIACLIGQHMLIHGGIGENGEYLDDCNLLSLNPFKWTEAQIAPFCEKPILAMHSCVLVIGEDIKNNMKFNIYKFPEVSPNKRTFSRIKEKGLYVFGGKSKDDHKPNNILRVLRIGKKPLEWITLETKGISPSPRYMCSLNFFEEGNYLIIHGGRNDLENKSSAFNDTFVFELYRLEWVKVVFSDDIKALHRYNHGAAVVGKNLIIFGGMNGNHFLGSGLFVVNLDPENVSQNNPKDFGVFGLGLGERFDKGIAKAFHIKLKSEDDSDVIHNKNNNKKLSSHKKDITFVLPNIK